MASDNGLYQPGQVSAPAEFTPAVTPSDSVDLAHPARSLYVGTAGDVALIAVGAGSVATTFKNVPAGTILPVRTARVKVTGTTAADIVALY